MSKHSDKIPMQLTGDYHADVAAETLRARTLFPGNKHMLAALVEEVGELAQALIDYDRDEVDIGQVYKEAVQVGAMAARVALDGDRSFEYEYSTLSRILAEARSVARAERDGAFGE